MRQTLSVFSMLLILFTMTSARAEVIELATAKEIPKALIDIVGQLRDRSLRLVGSSLKQLDPNLGDHPITCEFESRNGERFMSNDLAEDGLLFHTSSANEFETARARLGTLQDFAFLGVTIGLAYTYAYQSVTVEPGVIKFHEDLTYLGWNRAIPGNISSHMEYTFEPSANANLSSTKIRKSIIYKGSYSHYERICDYLVD